LTSEFNALHRLNHLVCTVYRSHISMDFIVLVASLSQTPDVLNMTQ